MVEIVPTPAFLNALAITAKTFLIGNTIAILLGVPMGMLMGRSALADRVLLPWVNMFISAPLSALVPVIMVLFGLGETTIILTVVLFAVWIIVLDTRAGVRNITPSLAEMARSFGATQLQAFWKVYLWAALPEILSGIRLGMIRAVKGVIIGQLLVSIVGFGRLFELYSSRFLMEHFWALLFILFAFAFLINEGLAWLERRVEYYAASR
jgi:NitT/TauT family transport system permease protein